MHPEEQKRKRHRYTMLLAFLALTVLSISSVFSVEGEKLGILPLYEKLKKIEIDTTRAARVDNFSFKKDIIEWKFESGNIYFTKPIPECPDAGGAYFIGQGKMIFTPPNKTERDQLKEYTDKEQINDTFTEAFFRFNDGTHQIFEPMIKEVSSDEGKSAASKFQGRQDLLYNLTFNLEFPIIEDYLSGIKRNQYLFLETDADVKEQGDRGWPCVFYNPLDVEEVNFFIHKRLDRAVGFSEVLTAISICKFNKKEDYENNVDVEREDKDLYHIFHYDMDFTIVKHDLFLESKVAVHLKPLVNIIASIQVPLWAEYDPDRHDKYIKINKITDAEGKELPFIYKNFTVLVQLPKMANKSDEVILNFDYRGDFIRPDFVVPPGVRIPASYEFLPESESTFTLLNTFPWFPQYGFLTKHTFDLTIRVPKPHVAVASGTTLKRWEEGDYNCLHSKEDTPVSLTSLLFGKYITIKDDSKRPVIYVHSLFKQQSQAKDVLNEARTIVDEYEKYFGSFPYEELDIAQMGFFYGFGQAPPGLVQLTGEAFLTQNELVNIGYPPLSRAAFMSHEIGHEWWGHLVGWQNYHEQWLSESFTEYMSGLYLEATRGEQALNDKLKEWKENAQMSKKSGPIWLGIRLAKDKFRPFDYTFAVYDKGPYVLHMLRIAFFFKFGPEKGNAIFLECMKNFLQKFKGQNAVTRDVQLAIKETAKVDMDWFFNQWFREAGFPELHCSHTTTKTEDGKYLLDIKIRQADKDHIKSLIVPIYLHFPGDRVVRKDLYTDKEEGVLKVKVPEKPELITVNDAQDMLAIVVYE